MCCADVMSHEVSNEAIFLWWYDVIFFHHFSSKKHILWNCKLKHVLIIAITYIYIHSKYIFTFVCKRYIKPYLSNKNFSHKTVTCALYTFSSPKYGITEKRDGYRGVMLLVVRSFSPSDVGTYHCVSTNSLGRAEGTLRLYGKCENYDLVFIYEVIEIN